MVEGNFIGTQGGGDSYGNALDGVLIDAAAGNTIGGTTASAANVISANNDGVMIRNPASMGNVVAGEPDRHDVRRRDACWAMPSTASGSSNAPGNTIGGTTGGAGNVISGNNWGVRLTGSGTTGNVVEGNFIGTDASGSVSVRNADRRRADHAGRVEQLDRRYRDRGGQYDRLQRRQRRRRASGSRRRATRFSRTRSSATDCSGSTSATIGVTLNHATATPGPNNFQNFPVISSIVSSGANPIIEGTLNSVANTSFLLQFYSNAVAPALGYGQGSSLLNSATVITDASGSAVFNARVSGGLGLGSLVSATATNLSTGSTSEFSLDVAYQLTTQFSAAAYSVSETDGVATITVTRSNSSSASDVNYATGGGTAGSGVNYTPTSGTLVFSAGQTSQSFTIPIIHDFQVTGPLTVGIALSSPTSGFLGTPSTAVLTINNVDQPGALEFSTSTMSVNAGATVANLTVVRVGAASGTVSVAYATSGGTAVAGTDYTPVSGVVTFKPATPARRSRFRSSTVPPGATRRSPLS